MDRHSIQKRLREIKMSAAYLEDQLHDLGGYLTGIEELILDLEEDDLEKHMAEFYPNRDPHDSTQYPEYEFIA